MGLGPQDAGYQEVIEVPMDSDHVKRVRSSVGSREAQRMFARSPAWCLTVQQ